MVSNIPFSDTAIFDSAFLKDNLRKQAAQKVHNYFFIKALDTLHDKGILAFLTSRGVLDSPTNRAIREYLVTHSDLVSAIRLPNNTFSNTQVGTDFIVLQKNNQKQGISSREEKFISSGTVDGVTLNSLLSSPDHIVMTSQYRGKDLYGKEAMIYQHQGGIEEITHDLNHILAEDLQMHFPSSHKKSPPLSPVNNGVAINPPSPLLSLFDLYDAQEKIESSATHEPPKKTPSIQRKNRKISKSIENNEMGDLFSLPPSDNIEISFDPRTYKGTIKAFYKDGVLVSDQGQIGHLRDIQYRKPYFHPLRLDYYTREKLEAYIRLRDTYQDLFYYEADHKKENPLLRQKLNQEYDSFISSQGGDLNSKQNAKYILMDTVGIEILSLEIFINGVKYKADILNKPVSFSTEEIKHTDNTEEALAISLNRFGRVNLNYIAELTDKDHAILLEELKGQIYYNPIRKDYETSTKLLSGNVIEKITLIEGHLKTHPDDLPSQEALEALKQIAPAPITYDELDFNLGERWIPAEVYSDFASNLFETEVKIDLIVDWDRFVIQCNSRNAIINQKYSVNSRNDGIDLLHHALYNTAPIITQKIRENGKEKTVVDNIATQLAGTKIEEIRNAFPTWLVNQSQELKDCIVLKKVYYKPISGNYIPCPPNHCTGIQISVIKFSGVVWSG